MWQLHHRSIYLQEGDTAVIDSIIADECIFHQWLMYPTQSKTKLISHNIKTTDRQGEHYWWSHYVSKCQEVGYIRQFLMLNWDGLMAALHVLRGASVLQCVTNSGSIKDNQQIWNDMRGEQRLAQLVWSHRVAAVAEIKIVYKFPRLIKRLWHVLQKQFSPMKTSFCNLYDMNELHMDFRATECITGAPADRERKKNQHL